MMVCMQAFAIILAEINVGAADTLIKRSVLRNFSQHSANKIY